MAGFAVIAEHPRELGPSSNAKTRRMMNEGVGQIPQLAEQLGPGRRSDDPGPPR
jgi:hypothetical protein